MQVGSVPFQFPFAWQTNVFVPSKRWPETQPKVLAELYVRAPALIVPKVGVVRALHDTTGETNRSSWLDRSKQPIKIQKLIMAYIYTEAVSFGNGIIAWSCLSAKNLLVIRKPIGLVEN